LDNPIAHKWNVSILSIQSFVIDLFRTILKGDDTHGNKNNKETQN